MDAAPPSRASTLRGCAAALGIGAGTILLIVGGMGLGTGAWSVIFQEWWVYPVWALMVAAPFGLLALAGIGARLPWLAGIALTALFWGGYIFEAFVLAEEGSGVNIGLALIMLASPVIIAAACFLAARLAR